MILILEDNADRLQRFKATLRMLDDTLEIRVWRDAWKMIDEVGPLLPSARIISLDHDLDPLGDAEPDPGTGWDFTKHLAALKPVCPVIVHTSNSERGQWMCGELELGGWKYHRVPPLGDDWIEVDWRRVVRKLLKKKGRRVEASPTAEPPVIHKARTIPVFPPTLATRLRDLQPTAVNRVLQEVQKVQAAGKSLVSLMRGQPDLPTPEPIVEAATRALRAGRTGYPDNRGEIRLREAVAERLQRDHNLTYDPGREILIVDGATSGLFAALGAILEPGCRVLLPDPIYDAYRGPIATWGGRVVPIPAEVVAGRFRLPPAVQTSSEARILLLNTPWNPVGTVFAKSELEAILDFAERNGLLVISDEIYETLVYDGKEHVSPASLTNGRARTLIVNSLSKTYSMTGWRVGYCAGPAWWIDAMFLILQQYSRGPATFVQDAAIAALRLDLPEVHRIRDEFQRRRELVLDRLRGIPGTQVLTPEGGFFALVDVRRSRFSSDEIRRKLLHEDGVVVLHGSAYGPLGEGYLRVSFGMGGASLEEGLKRLGKGLTRLCAEE